MRLEDLGSKSVRRNPLIADLLHRIAFIEKAGTGIRRMRDGARDQGYPEPEFAAGGFFTAVFRPIPAVNEQVTPVVTQQVPSKYPTSSPQVTPQVVALLRAVMQEASAAEIQSAMQLKDRIHFLKKHILPALEKGLIERTIPERPRSSRQRYRITPAGFAVLEHSEKEPQP
jgi:ATP-dependent DNA helicase RecG